MGTSRSLMQRGSPKHWGGSGLLNSFPARAWGWVSANTCSSSPPSGQLGQLRAGAQAQRRPNVSLHRLGLESRQGRRVEHRANNERRQQQASLRQSGHQHRRRHASLAGVHLPLSGPTQNLATAAFRAGRPRAGHRRSTTTSAFYVSVFERLRLRRRSDQGVEAADNRRPALWTTGMANARSRSSDATSFAR